jgi:hypothetical protein
LAFGWWELTYPPAPFSACFRVKNQALFGWKGEFFECGGEAPTQYFPPLKQNEKWALKGNLFERGSGGEPQKSTKSEQNPISILMAFVRNFWV